MAEITIPLSTVKKILTNNGEYRASFDAIKEFHNRLVINCKEAATIFQEKAVADRRKTIQMQDFE